MLRYSLIDNTKTDEPDEVYITKLSLSLGRSELRRFAVYITALADLSDILRPQHDNDLTIGDRTPSLFLADLITLYHQIFPALVEKKKKEADRVMPIRKRTALVDQRISRSRLSGETNVHDLLEAQHAKQNPKLRNAVPEQEDEKTGSEASGSAPAPPASGPLTTAVQAIQSAAGAMGLAEPVRPADGPPRFQEPIEDDEMPSRQGAPHSSLPPAAASAPATASAPNNEQHSVGKSAPVGSSGGVRGPGAPPSFVDPDSSDREEDGKDADDAASATASYLSSMEQTAEDAPIAGVAAVGSGGLRRAGSGEATRLRGPRGG